MSGLGTGSALDRFSRGMRYPLAGFRFLSGHPELWGWVAIPAVLNLVMFVLGVAASWMAAPALVGRLWSRPEEGLVFFLWFLTVWAVRLAMAAVVGMGVYMAAGLLAAPFNEVISERVEQAVLGDAGEPWGWRVFLRDTFFSLVHSLATMAIYALIMAPLLLVNLVPVIGSAVYLVLSWGLTAFFLSREMLDGVTSRRRMGFVDKLRLVRRHQALMLGFGVATNLMLWVPVVNLLCMPVAVVGATLMYCDLERQGLAPSRKALPER